MSLRTVNYDLAGFLLKKIGTTSDGVSATGLLTQNISDWVTLSGNDYSWAYDADASGFKNCTLLISAFTGMSASNQNLIIYKYDGTKLLSTSLILGSADRCNCDSNKLNITVSDINTGFLEAWVSGTSFTGANWQGFWKAYFNGWKLTTANANVASCVWTGITSGATQSGATGYTAVTTTIDTGFTPYKLIYKLSSPTTSQLGLLPKGSNSLKISSYGWDALAS